MQRKSFLPIHPSESLKHFPKSICSSKISLYLSMGWGEACGEGNASISFCNHQ